GSARAPRARAGAERWRASRHRPRPARPASAHRERQRRAVRDDALAEPHRRQMAGGALMAHERALDRPPRLVRLPPESRVEGAPAWIPVGVLLWRAEEHRIGLIVKTTFTWADEPDAELSAPIRMRFATEQDPLSGERRSRLPAAGDGELEASSDFVP